ncbi:DNA recombination protein RmuC [hydrothermal vent metagenome]|uniref:DNA recombination protein RmuC n=1 Tax=hydrothermal vent metagenome TaxID=652676 RepID=A0A3B0R6G3_9ZZZZ
MIQANRQVGGIIIGIFTMDQTVMMFIAGAFLLVVILGFFLIRGQDSSRNSNARQHQMMQTMAALEGRLNQMSEQSARHAAEVNRTLSERLDKVSQRMGDSLEKSTKDTTDSLGELKTRLAVIDQAQKNITDLSGQMVKLQDILSNKQARGTFGETQMNDLVSQILPPSAYGFQVTMSNGKRADCLIKLPNPPGAIVVDAKFPLEGYHMLRRAEDEAQKKAAISRFKADMLKHVKDISEKYIINGETAESALMFLPSEAVYAELHTNFTDVVEKSFRAKVWIVSPTTLMATLNTVRAVLKDARMREQAGVIQKEVVTLIEDVARLDDRVGKLRTHFHLAEKDIGMIETSTRKITSRGERIEGLQMEESESPEAVLEPAKGPAHLD